MTMKEMLENRKAAGDKIHELRTKMTEEKRDLLSVEERTAWDQANTDFDKYDQMIEDEKRAAHVTSRLNDTPNVPGLEDTTGGQRNGQIPSDEQRALAFQGWARFQLTGDVSEAQSEAMQAVGLRESVRELEVPLARQAPRSIAEARALTTTTTGGGYTIPQGFVNELEEAMLYYGGIRQVADIMRTTSGNAMPWPSANDTANKGAQIDESTADATDTDPSFGVTTFNAYKFTSKIVLVPFELLEDSAFNMVSVLARMLGERLGRIQNEKGTTGSGTDTPNGLVTAATLGVTAASATAITADELIDLQHSVDIVYRGQRSGFMLHDSILKLIRKLKDTNGAYIWQPANIAAGIGNLLLGSPYTVNNDMASAAAAAAKTVLFGDFSKYKIREVNSIRIKRLVERYAEYDQEGFVALMRFDSDLVNAGTNPVKYLAQAAGSGS